MEKGSFDGLSYKPLENRILQLLSRKLQQPNRHLYLQLAKFYSSFQGIFLRSQ